MKKIKFLHFLRILFLIIGSLGILSSLFFLLSGAESLNQEYNERAFGLVTPYFSTLLLILLIYGVYQVRQALFFSIKK